MEAPQHDRGPHQSNLYDVNPSPQLEIHTRTCFYWYSRSVKHMHCALVQNNDLCYTNLKNPQRTTETTHENVTHTGTNMALALCIFFLVFVFKIPYWLTTNDYTGTTLHQTSSHQHHCRKMLLPKTVK